MREQTTFEARFLLPEAYNRKIRDDRRHYNCLAFALGLTDYTFLDFTLYNWFYPNIVDAFQSKTQYYRIGIELVSDIHDINGDYGFILFGWLMGLNGQKGFHVARIEPDGQIVHKQGFKEYASYVKLEDLFITYPTDPHFFFKYTGEQKAMM